MWATIIRANESNDKRSKGKVRSMGILTCMMCDNNSQGLLDEEEANGAMKINGTEEYPDRIALVDRIIETIVEGTETERITRVVEML